MFGRLWIFRVLVTCGNYCCDNIQITHKPKPKLQAPLCRESARIMTRMPQATASEGIILAYVPGVRLRALRALLRYVEMPPTAGAIFFFAQRTFFNRRGPSAPRQEVRATWALGLRRARRRRGAR